MKKKLLNIFTKKIGGYNFLIYESLAFYNKFGLYGVVLRKRYNITKTPCVSWVKSLSETTFFSEKLVGKKQNIQGFLFEN